MCGLPGPEQALAVSEAALLALVDLSTPVWRRIGLIL